MLEDLPDDEPDVFDLAVRLLLSLLARLVVLLRRVFCSDALLRFLDATELLVLRFLDALLHFLVSAAPRLLVRKFFRVGGAHDNADLSR